MSVESVHGDTIAYTASGRRIDFADPQPEMICIDDIAHHLWNQCRFNGGTSRFYSIGEHSWIGAAFIHEDHRDEFLLHDAHEAYLGDLNGILKKMPELAGYRDLEQRWDRVIREKYGLPLEMSQAIHDMDRRMLMTEKRDLMSAVQDDWEFPDWMVPLGLDLNNPGEDFTGPIAQRLWTTCLKAYFGNFDCK